MLIDVAISGDRNVIKKEAEKILKYEDLTIEIQHMWNVKTRVIQVIIGVNGTISKSFRKYEPEINDRINRGRAAITKLNSISWDLDVTPKTKTHIYHAVVKSTITYAAETWCLKAKMVSKLNSTEIDFWR